MPSESNTVSTGSPRDKLGICQWFHYEAYDDVNRTLDLLRQLGVKHLRTGISWADFMRPGGEAWYDWQMKTLLEAGMDVLLSVWHTPPSLSENGQTNGPPRVLKDYADFIDLLITRYGDTFSALELWNEPNNRYKWDFVQADPGWRKFGEMIGGAAYWARHRGIKTVLGGMMPVDQHWLDLMCDYGVLPFIDIVAIHGFPEMWWENAPNWEWYHHWEGWEVKLDSIRTRFDSLPVWITETGLATWNMAEYRPGRHALQAQMLTEAALAPTERVYWYCALDLDPSREAIEGYHIDENEYHLGLVTYQGEKKPAFFQLQALLAGTTS